MEDKELIEKLRLELDEQHALNFELTSDLKRERMIRNELEELLRDIRNACLTTREMEEKPDLDAVLLNLAANINKVAEEYRIPL